MTRTSFRSSQNDKIVGLKSKIIPKKDELKQIYLTGDDLDMALDDAKYDHEQLTTALQNYQLKLGAICKEIGTITTDSRKKAEEISMLRMRLYNASQNGDEFHQLKQDLIGIFQEYQNNRPLTTSRPLMKPPTTVKHGQRKKIPSDILRRKVERTEETIQRNDDLHNQVVNRLKREEQILQKVYRTNDCYFIY